MVTKKNGRTTLPDEPNNLYCFYIITEDGKEIQWTHLKEIAAFRMNRTTQFKAPNNILKFGWKRMT